MGLGASFWERMVVPFEGLCYRADCWSNLENRSAENNSLDLTYKLAQKKSQKATNTAFPGQMRATKQP